MMIGDIVLREMPASEVMVHMKLVGEVWMVQDVRNGMCQLRKLDNGQKYSFPVTYGEAGVHHLWTPKMPQAIDGTGDGTGLGEHEEK